MKHHLHSHLVSGRIKVLVVGAGGTGSRVMEHLACLHRALIAKGHPQGLDVTLIDGDRVSMANVGRQAFYACDCGAYKADVLVNRINMSLGVQWKSVCEMLEIGTRLEYDLVIGCVDTRKSRLAILRGLEECGGTRYWLDFGNKKDNGQVILGEVTKRTRSTDSRNRLPHVAEVYPDVIDERYESADADVPSCSLAEALDKQSLFINPAMSVIGMSILWNLFTSGEIESHGAFVNLACMQVTPLDVDHDVWARLGVVRDGVRQKITVSRKKRQEVAEPAAA